MCVKCNRGLRGGGLRGAAMSCLILAGRSRVPGEGFPRARLADQPTELPAKQELQHPTFSGRRGCREGALGVGAGVGLAAVLTKAGL